MTKVGNGITAENVGTIITVMFIESCYEEVENKLTLQQGKNSTYFLLGELRDGFVTYEMQGITPLTSVSTTRQRELRQHSARRCWVASSP